jgi:LruC domain-containing protein
MNTQFSWLLLICPGISLAGGFGDPSQTPLSDTATICLEVNTSAELSGLDDITLVPESSDGAAGAIYRGSDEFLLSSNAPVRVIIDAPALTQGDYRVEMRAELDGVTRFFDTPEDGPHQQTHTLSVSGVLGAVSSQLAGHYESTLVLTVVPQVGGEAGCGEVTLKLGGDTQAEYAVLAFEDLYPNAGDADYNDFVVRYSVEEHYNTSGQLEKVDMTYTPVARGAGYNHALRLDLDGVISKTNNAFAQTQAPFEGDATVVVTYTNLDNGNESTKYYESDDDITIFHNTRSTLSGFANVYSDEPFTAPSQQTTVEIYLDSPELNLLSDVHEVATDKYRVYLDVLSTNNDIDLAVINPDDGMIDENGYPFGIVVADDWAWMLEYQNIESAYPYFAEYRDYLDGNIAELSPEAENWFNAGYTNVETTIDLEAFDEFLSSLTSE